MKGYRIFLSVFAGIFLLNVGAASPLFWERFLLDINPTLVGTLSFLEFAWIAVNLPGVIYSGYNSVDAYKDYQAVNHSKGATKTDCIFAWGNFRKEAVNTAIQGGYLAIGIISALIPPPAVRQVATLASASMLVIFIGGSLLLSWCSWRGAVDRRKIKDDN